MAHQILPVVVANNNEKLLQLLLEHGISTYLNRALNLACIKNYLNLVQLLLEHGSDVNTGDGEALYHSIINGNYKQVQLLLKYGAHFASFSSKFKARYGDDIIGFITDGSDEIGKLRDLLQDYHIDQESIDILISLDEDISFINSLRFDPKTVIVKLED